MQRPKMDDQSDWPDIGLGRRSKVSQNYLLLALLFAFAAFLFAMASFNRLLDTDVLTVTPMTFAAPAALIVLSVAMLIQAIAKRHSP